MVRCRVNGGKGVPMDPMTLAILAAQTVVAAASTDAWVALKHGVARLLGRGDPQREQLAGQRLDQTRDQLRAAPGQAQTQASLEAVWQAWLFSLLEAQPDAEAHLLALVEQARAQLPGAAAADHSVAAGRDVNIEAAGGGVAAAVIHGNVAPPNPTEPGLAGGRPDPGKP